MILRLAVHHGPRKSPWGRTRWKASGRRPDLVEGRFGPVSELATPLAAVGGPSVMRPSDDGALPGWRDAVHSGVGDQLAHMFVGMNDDAEVHPVDRGIAAFDLDPAGKFTGLQTRPSHLDRFE